MINRIISRGVWVLMILMSSTVLHSQSLDSIETEISSSSCSAGGEIWVCGATQQNQVHIDFDNNCSGFHYQSCSVIKTVVDVCSPNMRESIVYEPGDKNCPLNANH